MIDEEDSQGLMMPDGSGNRHGRDGSQTTGRSDTYPYDKPVTYGHKNVWEELAEIAGDAMDTKLSSWPWEAHDEDFADPDDEFAEMVWDKPIQRVQFDGTDKIWNCILQIQSPAKFHSDTSRGSPNVPGWMVDLEIGFTENGGSAEFVYHVEKRVNGLEEAMGLAERLRQFVDKNSMKDLSKLTGRGKLRMSKFTESVAATMGFGVDPFEMELDDLRGQFKNAFQDAMAQTQTMDSPSLFSLLTDLDPDFSAQAFAPDEDEEMQRVYFDWADTVCGTGEIE